MAAQLQHQGIQGADIRDSMKLYYQTIANFIGLVSQELYSRFSAMLTANSIMIAAIGIILSSCIKQRYVLISVFSIVGIILCVLWLFFNLHGTYWQNRYRESAKLIEQHIREITKYDDFRIWSLPSCGCPNYSLISTIVIIMFMVIYFVFLTTIFLFIDLKL